MALSVGNPTPGGTSTAKYFDEFGVWIDEVQIVAAQKALVPSRKPTWDPADAGIECLLETGAPFQPEFFVGGKFKRDDQGNVIDWGSVFKVRNFLVFTGACPPNSPINEDNTIPETWITNLVGKKFIRLRYVYGVKDGEAKFSTWDNVTVPVEKEDGRVETFDETALRFLNEFIAQADKYVNDYRPERLSQTNEARQQQTAPQAQQATPQHGAQQGAPQQGFGTGFGPGQKAPF